MQFILSLVDESFVWLIVTGGWLSDEGFMLTCRFPRDKVGPAVEPTHPITNSLFPLDHFAD